MFGAINSMMLDMLAAVARKDYDDRRRRQAQGIAKAKLAGAYRGRPEDTARHAGIASMLRAGSSWSAIQAAFARKFTARPPKSAIFSRRIRQSQKSSAPLGQKKSPSQLAGSYGGNWVTV